MLLRDHVQKIRNPCSETIGFHQHLNPLRHEDQIYNMGQQGASSYLEGSTFLIVSNDDFKRGEITLQHVRLYTV